MGRSPHWFEPIAEHLGRAYLRYSFTKGTERETDFLVEALALTPGDRVLDVGCGPGRHAHALARRGIEVVGVDVAERFVRLASQDAPAGARFVRADARAMGLRPGSFDAAISVCQGAFGLLRGEEGDLVVLAEVFSALRTGGSLALTAFNAFFRVRYPADSTFDPDAGVDHERTEIRDEAGIPATVDLWTTCYTPRELRLLASMAGLEMEDVWSVAPGDYSRRPPDAEHPELLVVARKPTS